MRTFMSEGVELSVPEMEVVDRDAKVFQITEGDQAGVCFRFDNMRMDDSDETLLWYDLDIVDAAGNVTELSVDNIKPIVDNFILLTMYEMIERIKNENSTAE